MISRLWGMAMARAASSARSMSDSLMPRALREMPELTLHVAMRNAPAVKAYERAGYRRIGELRLAIFPPAPS